MSDEMKLPALPQQEISPEALDELFQRDPRDISDEEFEKIILHYRSQRGRFVQAEAKAQADGKKQTRMPKQENGKKEPRSKATVPVPLSLADLGLGESKP